MLDCSCSGSLGRQLEKKLLGPFDVSEYFESSMSAEESYWKEGFSVEFLKLSKTKIS